MLNFGCNLASINIFSKRVNFTPRHFLPGGTVEMMNSGAGREQTRKYHQVWEKAWNSDYSEYQSKRDTLSLDQRYERLEDIYSKVEDFYLLRQSLEGDNTPFIFLLSGLYSGYRIRVTDEAHYQLGVLLDTRNFLNLYIEAVRLRDSWNLPTVSCRLGTGNTLTAMFSYLYNNSKGPSHSYLNHVDAMRIDYEKLVEEDGEVLDQLQDQLDENKFQREQVNPEFSKIVDAYMYDLEKETREQAEENHNARCAVYAANEYVRRTQDLEPGKSIDPKVAQAEIVRQTHELQQMIDQRVSAVHTHNIKSQVQMTKTQLKGQLGIDLPVYQRGAGNHFRSLAAQDARRFQPKKLDNTYAQVAASVVNDYLLSDTLTPDPKTDESHFADVRQNPQKAAAASTIKQISDDVSENTTWGSTISMLVRQNASDEWIFNSPIGFDVQLVLPLLTPQMELQQSLFLMIDLDVANLLYHYILWGNRYLYVSLSLYSTTHNLVASKKVPKTIKERILSYLNAMSLWGRGLYQNYSEVVQQV